MAESLVYKPRMDLSDDILFRLSLYYIFVEPKVWKVASLLNQYHNFEPGIATQEVMATYDHLHDIAHPAWIRAKDMAREESQELKQILRCEIRMEPERWDVGVVQPVKPMARLRPARS